MIDFLKIDKYCENNRIEAKKALGGLPHSIWETYSAFANTFGGIILLGVEEYSDASFHPLDLPAPEAMVKEFWQKVQSGRYVSANILSPEDVSIENVDGKHIIAIRIPRAQRFDKPVFIGGDAFSGSYRRNGEGDYRCSKQEVEAMLRDADYKTSDMRILGDAELYAIDYGSVARYRKRYNYYLDNDYQNLDDFDFLQKIGALSLGGDGKLHPTGAGLLVFGCESEIKKQFPHYKLKYKGRFAYPKGKIASGKGEWSGNLFDFFFRAHAAIASSVQMNDNIRDEFKPLIYKVVHEALANCIINADYNSRGMVLVTLKSCEANKAVELIFKNPGLLRVDLEAAKSGGLSDPRNYGITKIFNAIGIGKGNGFGIADIFGMWNKMQFKAPVVEEKFNPDYISLTLPISVKKIERRRNRGVAEKYAHEAAIVGYLTENVFAEVKDICGLLGLQEDETIQVLNDMLTKNIIQKDASDENIYKLKS